MTGKSYQVIARSDGSWSVKRTGAERISGRYSTKKDAVTTAKRLVKAAGGGELIVHASDGRVVERNVLDGDRTRANGNGNSRSRNGSAALKG